MRDRAVAWISTTVLVLLGCGPAGVVRSASPSQQVPIDVELDVEFSLGRGEVARLTSTNVAMQFDRVSADSRCPTGVTCVWEGDATVWLRARIGEASRALELHTSQRFSTEASVEGLLVRLIKLAPRPDRSGPPDPTQYVVTLMVTRP